MRKIFHSVLMTAFVFAILFSVSVSAFAAGAWSDWTTDTTKLSDSKYQSESKAQYATRTKETTTSKESSLSGWTRDDSKTTSETAWGSTVWYDYQISTSDTCRYVGTRQVATGTQYYLYRYYSSSKNLFATYKKDSTYVEDGYWVSSYYSYDPYNTGYALYQSNEISGSKYPCWLGGSRQVTKTQYGYQTGTVSYTYSYYRYSDWSSWTDGSNTASDTVKTRTLYRYRLKDGDSTPTASLTAKDNLSATQKVTVTVADDYGLQGYFFGTNSDYKKNTFTQLNSQTSYSTELSVKAAGTYYLVAINNKDKVSSVASVTLYTITLNPSNGTVSASKLLLAKSHKVTLPVPSKNKCTFLGWSTDSNAASGSKSITVSGNQTYYAIWGNVSAAGWSQANQYKFVNSSSNFTTGVYTMKDREFNKLANYIRSYYSYDYANRLVNYIAAKSNSKWEGSCYGMSLSAILDFTNQIGMNENFGNSASTVHDISAPYMNADAQSAINYYQLLQYLPNVSNAYTWAYKSSSNWSMALSGLITKVKNGELVSFLYFFDPNLGHSIVIKSYGGTDSNGNTILKAYDNRFPNTDVSILISSDLKSCTVKTSSANEVATGIAYLSNYDIYDKYDIDGKNNDMSISATSSTKKSVSGTTIAVSAANNVTIRNSAGKTIVVKNGQVASSSTAKILSTQMIVHSTSDGEPAAPTILITVGNSDYFSFETASGTIDASVLNSDYFASVNASDASSAVVSGNDGVYVNGDHAKYTVTCSVSESDFDMYSFTGTANGSANIDYSEGKICVSGNVPGNVKVSKFSGTECETVSFATSSDNVAVTMVDDYCETHSYKYYVITKATTERTGEAYKYCTKCGHKEKTQTVAKIASVALSATSFTYDGTAKTPTVTVKDSAGKKLANKTDYTVTYSSGRKAVGKYTVKITFINRYSGTKSLTFKIIPANTTISSLTNTSSGITIKWAKNSAATGYILYRSINGGDYASIKKITSNSTVSFTDKEATKNGSKYCYKIRSYKTVSDTNYTSTYSAAKTLYRLSSPSISSVTAASKGFTVKWGSNSKASGYLIQYSTTSDFKKYSTKTISSSSTVSSKISSLSGSKKYYVRVRSFKTVGNTKYYSGWSSTKSITTKK